MLKKTQWLLRRRTGGRAEPDRETIDRLVSAVLENDSGQAADPADGNADDETLETLRLIRSIRQVGASDSPLPESGVDAIMGALEGEARSVPRQDAWREWLGMASGFLASSVTLGSGLLLVGGAGDVGPPGAVATPVLAAAVASLAALASVLVHRRSTLRLPILPLLVLGALVMVSCAPTPRDAAAAEVAIDLSALTTFEEGEELWGVRDVIESGEAIWALTEAAPFLRAYGRSGRLLADFGRSGQGPGELFNPWVLSAAASPREVIVWDLATRRRSRFDAGGNFVTSTPAPTTRGSIRADIRSVTFGDPFRVAEDGTGAWVASYPGGLNRGDDFWSGRLLRITHADAEPTVALDFAVDLPGAATRVPVMGLAPVPLWDGCPDGVVAVLDPIDRSLHLHGTGGTKTRSIPLPWPARPLSHEERLGYVREMMRNETRGTNMPEAEIERAAADALARAGDHLPAEAPIGIDLRCSPGRVWIQAFDGSSHPLGYGRAWSTVSLGDPEPQFQRVIFPDGFTPYRFTDTTAIGVLTDAMDLQRVAVVRLTDLAP
ncbi:hypothetical protein [Candidatus Palauibacter sp.]|uniref:hypothetical protein n=1 Tax=Candidatus Palauibacter sp. TaxID=3101350 RepID=UPI003AF284CD